MGDLSNCGNTPTGESILDFHTEYMNVKSSQEMNTFASRKRTPKHKFVD